MKVSNFLLRFSQQSIQADELEGLHDLQKRQVNPYPLATITAVIRDLLVDL